MGNFRALSRRLALTMSRRLVWAVTLPLLALGPAHTVMADGGIPAGIGAFSPGTLPNTNIAGGILPPIANFQTCAALGMAGGMGAAALGGMGNSASAIGSLAGLLPGGGGAAGGLCKQPDTTSLNPTDCTNYQDSDGTYNPAKVTTVTALLSTELANVNCEKNDANAVKTELQCFQNQGNALVQQANQDQALLSQAINQAEQEVTLLKSQESDRTDQLADVGAKLGGDSSSKTPTGKEGLLTALTNARAQLTQMTADTTNLSLSVQKIQHETLTYQTAKTARIEALAVNCFTTQTSGSFKCVPNGPPVSAAAYALCRVQQNAMVGANGLYENSQSNQEKAAGQQAALQSLFTGMFGNTSTVPDPSASPNLTGATPDLTIAQLEAQYTSQLAAFNGNGLNIQNFVLTALNACNNSSTTTVAQEETTAGTLLNNMQVADTTDFNTSQAAYKSALEGYRQRYNQWYSDLSGQEINLPVDQCEAVGVDTWNSCMANTQAAITGLINGTTPESQIPLMFSASRNPNMTIQMAPCKGLAGCVNDLQSLSTGLTHDLAQRVQGRTNWVLQANQSVTTMAKNMAANYSQQSTMVNQQLSAIQGVMSQLGIRGGFQFSPFPPETPQFNQEADGSNGLIKAPTNLLGFMNNYANPQILNISPDGMSGAMDGIAEKVNAWNGNATKITEAQTGVAAGAQKCKGTQLKQDATTLATAGNMVNTDQCSSNVQWCQANLTSLQSLVTDIQGDVSSYHVTGLSDPSAGLSSGMSNCQNAGQVAATKLDAQISNLQSQIDTANSQLISLQGQQSNLDPSDPIYVRIQGQINSLNQRINSNQTKMTAMQTQQANFLSPNPSGQGDPPPAACGSVLSQIQTDKSAFELDGSGGSSSKTAN